MQQQLFDVSATPPSAEHVRPPDFYNLIATERGLPPGWRWYSLNVIGVDYDAPSAKQREHGAVMVKGAICTAIYKSGPRKGERNWTKRTDERELVITFRELEEFTANWEIKTALCSNCGSGGDSGKELVSAGVNGPTYRPCTKHRMLSKAATSDGTR